MRETKFRGKRVDNGECVYGYYDGCYDTATINYLKNKIPYNACVIPESVGQYTGLKDKNGKEIYEGDICRHFCKPNEVIYHNGAFGYKVDHLGFISYAGNYNFDWKDGQSEFIEVIGNVYENPELLEV